jgi:hypothetical protein
MAESAPAYDPFFNVRRGGPKEKRIRRVELMGEHKPKPIYYIKAVQSLNDELLTDDVLRNYFENRFDDICDIFYLRSYLTACVRPFTGSARLVICTGLLIR